jgi:hypothetical protein
MAAAIAAALCVTWTGEARASCFAKDAKSRGSVAAPRSEFGGQGAMLTNGQGKGFGDRGSIVGSGR